MLARAWRRTTAPVDEDDRECEQIETTEGTVVEFEF
jgi:hypothetical protein